MGPSASVLSAKLQGPAFTALLWVLSSTVWIGIYWSKIAKASRPGHTANWFWYCMIAFYLVIACIQARRAFAGLMRHKSDEG
jgi:hypothetical protein